MATSPEGRRSRIGVDIGGTFTDVVAVDAEGTMHIGKTLTTPGAEERGVLAGIRMSESQVKEADLFVHGTTLVINALVQRSGSRTALITTLGFRDVVLMGRSNRPQDFNLFYRRDEPLVPRHRIFEIKGRIRADGKVAEELDLSALDSLAKQLQEVEVDAVAVALLNSYVNPEHEERLAAELRAVLPGVYISTSESLSRSWREYERFSTAVANAYVGPEASRYLQAIDEGLTDEGFSGSFVILDSNGGALGAQVARDYPIRLVESGPVGGVLGALDLIEQQGIDHAVSFDMGGTTAKAALIEDKQHNLTDMYWPTGYETGFPIQIPCVDIVEVGAGGGSIAWVDEGGRLRVGPQSAGAAPGPACYGNGGEEFTVTDANVYCGRLQADYFIGSLTIRPELARRAAERLAKRLDMDPLRLAQGVLQLANLSMAEAVRRQTVMRGRDPRSFTLIGFGGAGPLHACEVAAEVGVRRVIIPVAPGHFSAYGMLQADLRFDRRELVLSPLGSLDEISLNSRLAQIGEELRKIVEESSGRTTDEDVMFDFALEIRYSGQEHTVSVPAPGSGLYVDRDKLAEFRRAFDSEYLRRFGHNHPNADVEVVEVYVSGRRRYPKVHVVQASPVQGSSGARDVRDMYVDGTSPVESAVVARDALSTGEVVAGPALIYENGSNVVVPPGAVARVLEGGPLEIDLHGMAQR
jgi:N-methylhydantoinase A